MGKLKERAKEIHSDCVIVDAHCDTLIPVLEGRRSLGEYSESGHLDIPRLKKAGVDVQFFAAFVNPIFKKRTLYRTLELLDALYTEAERNSDSLIIAGSGEDIDRAVKTGKIAAILALEGGDCLEGSLGVLRMLHRLGVRSITLTWNHRNDLADGVAEARTNGGLTEFGVAVVEEMNRLKMLVDVSHLSEAGFWDVIEVSKQPFIASHSNSSSVYRHRRNLDDNQVRALARKGGVIGINFYSKFVGAGKVTVDDLLDHIDHIASVGGMDCIGLGSDFDGIDETVEGLEDVSKLWMLTYGLLRRGYKDGDIKKILGGNFLRVIREVLG